jgi:CIC family chloride channel protein
MTGPSSLLARLRVRENQAFLVITVVIGVLAGLGAVLFSLAIEITTRSLFGLSPSAARLFFVPAAVSIVTGVLLAYVFPDVRGSGVPQTKAAYHLPGSALRGRVAAGKFLTGVLCIGSGHSMGREGPSVQIGAALASAAGRWLRLSPGRVRELIPVGAAGALAAAFNTPVAAVLFALEEIIGDTNAPLIGSTVIASVASVIVARSIVGNEPLFHVPTYHLVHPAELLAYAALGLVGGIVSVIFCKGLLRLRAAFARLPPATKWAQPALGGVAIGAMLIAVPGVMGVGYELVDRALNSSLLLQTMLVLFVAKVIATTVSYASGNAGGIFAPSLYIGAMAGGAVGVLVHTYAPFPTADPGAYALVGMGALFAGIIRAPMTSVFMIFEITQDYQILVPLMLANMLSFVISRHYQHEPVYHALLRQDGIHLPAGAVHRRAAGRTAGDVMRPADAESFTVPRHSATIHVHPDHPLDLVIERLALADGTLPVVDRRDVSRVIGVITPESLLGSVVTRPLSDPGPA